ncbi:MAG: 4-(cytidine 5'-diphospho)-2-C-methyl-D-erythritol kinase [Chitinophagaceae bacterium]
MIVFPNCKINLGLNILRKRSDGYHDLETIFCPLPLTDVLEIIEHKQGERTLPIHFSSSGLQVLGDTSSNICVKAYRLLKKRFPLLPSIQIHLHKMIPSGAGLGGGSADAAFTLLELNRQFKLGLSQEALLADAAELGSDCPFFIINKPCFASGTGNQLEEIQLDLSGYKFLVVNPGIHIETGRAFLQIKPAVSERSIREIIKSPMERWKDELKNDFENVIFKTHRPIVDIKDELYRQGAIYASMSGSGSTVYGIFHKDKQLPFSFPDNYFVKELICK